jgi:hypothetical protein
MYVHAGCIAFWLVASLVRNASAILRRKMYDMQCQITHVDLCLCALHVVSLVNMLEACDVVLGVRKLDDVAA